MLTKTLLFHGSLLLALSGVQTLSRAAEFDTVLKPLLAQHCTKCHGGKEVNADVNFKNITSLDHLRAKPELIQRIIEAVDGQEMPPDTEPALAEKTRTQFVAALKSILRDAKPARLAKANSLRRLNRLQYNNSVKDLFQLKTDLFPLPEKLMTRHDSYLRTAKGKMPDRVNVYSSALNPKPGLTNVNAFPKDLRASNGFDNQANQLTLSPLLLDAFLRLAASIVESPDFNEKNVGVWNDFFKPPPAEKENTATDNAAEIKRRLAPFLKTAFRGPVSDETLDRYTAFALAKLSQGLSFTDSMKKVASAALSSPMFLFRSSATDSKDRPLALASNLSFFLWSSGPDLELLQLAESGELLQPDVLNKTIDRMLADPKIERFLDSFPSQWMQLENVLSATPDPQINKYFSLDKNSQASLHMLIEPLLLFDAVFIEDRPIIELIAPKFSYQSNFLKTWYTSDLKPPKADLASLTAENRRLDERRKDLEKTSNATQAERAALWESVKANLLTEQAAANTGEKRTITDKDVLAALTPEQRAKIETLDKALEQAKADLKAVPPNRDPGKEQQAVDKKFEEEIRNKMRSPDFDRVPATDPRYGGVITNAAILSMTSGAKRTHPIARGAWVIGVIFNNPPAPPPNNVPPFKEETDDKHKTIREQFAAHRENPSCAGCHAKLDPLGFALENFDITGRWRDKYENGRDVDASGTLFKKYEFDGIVRFKESLVKENRRFAKAFTGHLLRFALAGELSPSDSLTIEKIVNNAEPDDFKLKSLLREVLNSDSFLQSN